VKKVEELARIIEEKKRLVEEKNKQLRNIEILEEKIQLTQDVNMILKKFDHCEHLFITEFLSFQSLKNFLEIDVKS